MVKSFTFKCSEPENALTTPAWRHSDYSTVIPDYRLVSRLPIMRAKMAAKDTVVPEVIPILERK